MDLRGYAVSGGYMGYVNGKWILFETEEAYVEYMKSLEKE